MNAPRRSGEGPGAGSSARWSRTRRVALVASLAGFVVAAVVAGLSEGGLPRTLHAYLVNFSFFLSLSLGALFFVMIQHVTRAGWSVAVRRLSELPAAATPVLAVAFLPIAVVTLLSVQALYPWAAPSEAHAASGATHGHGAGSVSKALYLSPPFFVLRWVAYFVLWSALAIYLWRESTRQDRSGSVEHTLRMQRASAGGLIVYGVTVTLAAFDLLMSLTPAWYSSIFGVYFFSGSAVGFVALLIVGSLALARSGALSPAPSVDHYHDLGKYLFGFVFFWGYIAFSQYMLLWYANLPETTFWFHLRGVTTAEGEANAWSLVSLALLLGHFVIPFLALLPRSTKRNPRALCFWALWVLAFHWIDLWWIVLPVLGPDASFGLPELATFAAIGGLFVAALAQLASRAPLVPAGDPRLGESLAPQHG